MHVVPLLEEKAITGEISPGAGGLKPECKNQGEHHGGEGNAFDQRGCDQHVCADPSCGLRLTGNAFDCLSTDLTDTTPGTNDGQAHSD